MAHHQRDERGMGLGRVRLVRDGVPGEFLRVDVLAFAQTADVGHDEADSMAKVETIPMEGGIW